MSLSPALPNKQQQNGATRSNHSPSIPAPVTSTSTLNRKQRIFVAEYVIDENGIRAAKEAGYSPKCAHAQACRLLKRADVKYALLEERKALEERSKVKQDHIVAELRKIAFGSLGEHDGDVLDLANMPRDIKLSDKLKALDQLARLLGFNAPDAHIHAVGSVDLDTHERARRILGIFNRAASVPRATDPD